MGKTNFKIDEVTIVLIVAVFVMIMGVYHDKNKNPEIDAEKITGLLMDDHEVSFASGGVTRDDTNTTFEGCALVEMLGSRTLKFETRLKEPCEDIQSFSANARIYTR